MQKTVFFFAMLLVSLSWGQSSNPVGDAFATGGNCYAVTAASNWQLGAVWFNDALSLNDPFDITLTVNLGNNDGGADGLVFVFQQVGTDAIGLPGGGIGFEGFQPSLGIEMDTHMNPETMDPAADHLAIQKNGNVNHSSFNNLLGPVNTSATATNVEDGVDHTFRLIWEPSLQLLEVYFDCELRLSYSADIINEVFEGDPTVFWGFTGATGGLNNQQTVCISEFALGLQQEYDVCAGESIELGVVGAPGGDFEWTPTTYMDDPFTASPTITPEENITYTVTFTDICGETTELSTDINVVELEVSVPALTEVCEGNTAVVEATGNAENYTWSDDQEGSTAEFDVSADFTVTGITGACEATAEGSVLVYPEPELADWTDAFQLCEGESVVLDASTPEAVDYEWSTLENTAAIEVNTSGSYEVTLFSAEGCSNSYTAEVAVTPFPTPALSDSLSSCEGQAVVLDVSGFAEDILWSTGETSAAISVENDGWYTVNLSNQDCVVEDSIHVSFLPVPSFEVESDFLLCPGDTSWLLLPEEAYQWIWQGTVVNDSIPLFEEGIFDLSATDTSVDCSSAAEVEVAFRALPEVELPDRAVLCENSDLTLTAYVANVDSILWNTGDTTRIVSVNAPGEYRVTVSNSCGVDSSATEVFSGRCDCPVFVPNAFSPDLDGINEQFKPSVGCEVERYQFSVYNRWGELLFVTDDPTTGWNGSGPDRTHWVGGDVYAWKLEYEVRLFDGLEVIQRTGHVVVLR